MLAILWRFRGARFHLLWFRSNRLIRATMMMITLGIASRRPWTIVVDHLVFLLVGFVVGTLILEGAVEPTTLAGMSKSDG